MQVVVAVALKLPTFLEWAVRVVAETVEARILLELLELPILAVQVAVRVVMLAAQTAVLEL
jgi:hypothetical protein